MPKICILRAAPLLLANGLLISLATMGTAGEANPLASEDHTAPAMEKDASAPKPAENAERKVLFYRNPMGLPDTSPVPKKDSMGMDYIPVYADEAPAGTGVKVGPEKIQKTGVRTVEARRTTLNRIIRAPGTVKPDERSLRSIALRADAFIEKLYVNEMGRHVTSGEPLFRVYSQEMLRALVDLRRGRSGEFGAGAALLSAEQKLHNLEVPKTAIEEARTAREIPMSFDWPSPISGIVMEKKVIEGQMAKMGEELFRIVDLSTVWVIASVAEQDLKGISPGAEAAITFKALPGERFTGKVTLILHELDAATRTAHVRIEVDNPEHRIRHEMYADVEISSSDNEKTLLTVPASAVIDSGNRQVVFVDMGNGRFEPRDVKLGGRGQGRVEIREGLAEGERVVVSGNFLIDAESNLNAALSSFTAGEKQAPKNGAPQ
jgi:Cu(I)/Ag(I) efflux system membrane fusion protein